MERFAPSQDTLEGQNADVYFNRTREVLLADKRDPVVTMEFFSKKGGMLCGMNEVLTLLDKVLLSTHDVFYVDEGLIVEPHEVVLRVRAPYCRFGRYETAILGILSSSTGWATAAWECVQAAQYPRPGSRPRVMDNIPLVAFGARHIHPDISAKMEYAAQVAGFAGCSTLKGAVMTETLPIGSMPHAFILCVGDTVEAAHLFATHISDKGKRVILVDTFQDEAEEAIRVAEHFHAINEPFWGIRLDTPSERGGVTPELVCEVRAKLDMKSFHEVRIAVSGGMTPERIFDLKNTPVDMFGVGSHVSGASPIDFTADIKEVGSCATAKRGRMPGITDNPRLKSG